MAIQKDRLGGHYVGADRSGTKIAGNPSRQNPDPLINCNVDKSGKCPPTQGFGGQSPPMRGLRRIEPGYPEASANSHLPQGLDRRCEKRGKNSVRNRDRLQQRLRRTKRRARARGYSKPNALGSWPFTFFIMCPVHAGGFALNLLLQEKDRAANT